MKKRLFSILLSFAMVITMIPMATGVAWADVQPPDGAAWIDGTGTVPVWYKLTESNTVLTIGGTGDMPDFKLATNKSPWYADSTNVAIQYITIEEGVTSIGNCAFHTCTSLNSVVFPSSLTRIGSQAFENCSSLNSVTIPQNVTSIGESAFRYAGLANIDIPERVADIKERAFADCRSLTDIRVAEKNTAYTSRDGVLFSKDMTTLICFPSAKVCTENTYTIPETVTSISTEAFRVCTKLTKITIPSSVTSIGTHAFLGCTGLTSMVIPENVTSIGMSTFLSCSNLNEVTIPSGVTSIGNYTFKDCSSLATVTCLATTPPALGTDAFKSCNAYLEIYVPAASVNTYKSATGWSTYADKITTTATGTNLNPWKIGTPTDSDVIAYLDNGTLHIQGTGAMKDYVNRDEQPWKESGAAITSVEIGDDVTNIGNYAFYECTSLTNITIRESVTSIGQSAFESCNKLENIIIPASIKSIGCSAFQACTSLTNITIPASTKSIDSYAFQGCTSITNITIPASMTSIGDRAFNGCSQLATVTCLATTPPTLGEFAFYGGVDPISGIAIYVPAESVEAYTSSDTNISKGWNAYADKIQAKPVTIADILPENFPTYSGGIPDNAWKNRAGSKMYINNNGLTFGGVNLYNILSKPVTEDGNNYKYISNPYTITFVMDSDKLVKVITEGAENADNNGEYIPPLSPAPYTPTEPTIVVPVSGGEEKVEVSATVSGKKATVREISDKDIEKVVSGDKGDAVVEIDLSGLDKNISEVELPVKTVEKIAEATQASGKEDAGMSVKMSTATVTFDAKATQAMVDQAEGNTIQLVVDDIKTVSLNAVQKEAVEKLDAAIIIDAYLVSNGTKRCTESKNGFAGGKATVALQYEIKNNRTPLNYKVFYVDDNGKLTNLKAKYNEETKSFVFDIEHFSNYAVAYDENGELQASKVNLTKTTTYKNGKIKLTFKRLKLSDGKKITSYQIYRSTSKKFNKNLKKYSIKRTANTKSYTWTNSKKLKKCTKYYYKVRGRVKLSDGTYAYTQWSKVKTAKCKKSR